MLCRVVPLSHFHEICKFCTTFQNALTVKIRMDLLKGLRSYEGFKLRVSGFTQIFRAPSGESTHRTHKSFGGARTCARSSITVPSLVGLGFHPPRGPKTSSFLSVCLSVRRAFEGRRFCVRFRREGVRVQTTETIFRSSLAH